jgi:hypothetical protein
MSDYFVGKITQLTHPTYTDLLPGEKVLPHNDLYKFLNKEQVGLKLKNDGLGSLKQIADMLWRAMEKEVERNGHSDLTLSLESAVRGIYEIIELNNIFE